MKNVVLAVLGLAFLVVVCCACYLLLHGQVELGEDVLKGCLAVIVVLFIVGAFD